MTTANTCAEQSAQSEINTFSWSGPGLLKNLKPGHRVLMNTKMGNGKVLVSPPGRVLSIRRYRVKNRRKAIVYVEVPKNKRKRDEDLSQISWPDSVRLKPNVKSHGRATVDLGGCCSYNNPCA